MLMQMATSLTWMLLIRKDFPLHLGMESQAWWESDKLNLSTNNGSMFQSAWAGQMLLAEGLRTGKSVVEFTAVGTPKVNFVTLVEMFEKLGGKSLYVLPPTPTSNSSHAYLVWPKSCVNIYYGHNDQIEAKITTIDDDFYSKAKVILDENVGPCATPGRVYVLINSQSGPRLESFGVGSTPLERDNYNPESLEDYDAVVEDLRSANPKGRLAIFDGAPGTGKTFMIKGLLADVPDALFVLVPVSIVPDLASPAMINAIIEANRFKGDRPAIFIIEDADNCLGGRDASNVNAVSALLNLGDGIIGALADIRLVCTTNLKDADLDDAVIRSGRLSRKVHVEKLRVEVARHLYQKLTGKLSEINYPTSLSDVYAMARDAGWKPVVKNRPQVGFTFQGGPGEPMAVVRQETVYSRTLPKNIDLDPVSAEGGEELVLDDPWMPGV
jgi:hypothetical protein